MYELLAKLEALIEKWENAPYMGDYTKATRAVCAKELRELIGSPKKQLTWVQDTTSTDVALQEGFFEEDPLGW